MNKTALKKIVISDLIINLPISMALSMTADILHHLPFSLHTLKMIGISFVLACVISLILPIPKIAHGASELFHLDPASLAGRLVSNIPVCLIFVILIGLTMIAINVPDPKLILPAFTSTFLTNYIVCYIVAFTVVPIAGKVLSRIDK